MRATDVDGNYVETLFNLTITINYIPTVTTRIEDMNVFVNVAWTYTYPASTFSDANVPSDTLTYSVTGMPAWMTFTAATKTFAGTPTADGNFTVTLSCSDGWNGVGVDSFIIQVGTGLPNTAPTLNTSISDFTATVS